MAGGKIGPGTIRVGERALPLTSCTFTPRLDSAVELTLEVVVAGEPALRARPASCLLGDGADEGNAPYSTPSFYHL